MLAQNLVPFLQFGDERDFLCIINAELEHEMKTQDGLTSTLARRRTKARGRPL